jgi:hypothetical protein
LNVKLDEDLTNLQGERATSTVHTMSNLLRRQLLPASNSTLAALALIRMIGVIFGNDSLNHKRFPGKIMRSRSAVWSWKTSGRYIEDRARKDHEREHYEGQEHGVVGLFSKEKHQVEQIS